MPNSDTQDGLHNKITKIIYQKEVAADGSYPSNVAQSFSGNLTTAKDFFLTAEAQALNDTNGTQIEYAIHADGNGLIFTIAFGTKGAGTAEGDDHAAKWTETKDALIAADNWIAGDREGVGAIAWAGGGGSGAGDNGEPYTWLATDSAEHLF